MKTLNKIVNILISLDYISSFSVTYSNSMKVTDRKKFHKQVVNKKKKKLIKNLNVFLDVIVNDLRDDVARQPFEQIHLQELLVRVVEDRDDRVALALVVLLKRQWPLDNDLHLLPSVHIPWNVKGY